MDGKLARDDEEELTMDIWKERVQQDINDLKNNQSQMRNDINTNQTEINSLKMNDKLQDKEIDSLKNTLIEIREDTQWIRRKITGALITAAVTAVVAGIIGIAISKIF